MTVIDDLATEQDRLEGILDGLDDAQWASPSGCPGWTITDVVLHLAQSEEAVASSVTGGPGLGPRPAGGPTLDQTMDDLVRSQRAAPAAVFERWRQARRAAVDALRRADPDRSLHWVDAPLKPVTLATTRLAEHWTHGLDIAGPLGLDYPDTARLRHVAWLAHRSLPYALSLAGEPPHPVFCDLTGPGGESWQYGPPEAPSAITGSAGAFCRVAAQRLSPDQSGLAVRGPHAATALRHLRTYAA